MTAHPALAPAPASHRRHVHPVLIDLVDLSERDVTDLGEVDDVRAVGGAAGEGVADKLDDEGLGAAVGCIVDVVPKREGVVQPRTAGDDLEPPAAGLPLGDLPNGPEEVEVVERGGHRQRDHLELVRVSRDARHGLDPAAAKHVLDDECPDVPLAEEAGRLAPSRLVGALVDEPSELLHCPSVQ